MSRAHARAAQTISGVVVHFDAAKRFGFIARDDGGANLFFHADAARSINPADLTQGLRVTATVGSDRTGRARADLVERAP